MYEQFYGLTDKPFSLTPNPRFVFYSQQYREAEGQLLYGINNREGFMLVTGQPGTGKTTLCRDLIEKLDRTKTQSALIFNPFLNGTEMLAALLTEFGVKAPAGASRKDQLDRLNQFLLAQLALGRSCVAIFDEAQHLSSEFLEQIRVLSNLETDREKLIQIVLVGQPELLDKIRTPRMSQLDQRVSIRCTLMDLDEQETDRYINHRLNVAGARGQVRFSSKAVAEIYRASHGVPRLINLICDRALLAGFAAQTRDIQVEQVRKAVAALRGEDAEVRANVAQPKPPTSRRLGFRVTGVAAAVVAVAASAAFAFWPRSSAVAGPPDEALYWQATMSSSPTDAERELRTLVSTYPSSKRLDDALLHLAQIEMARGDRASAIQHLTQLQQHAPAGTPRRRAVVLTAIAQLDGGDTASACRSIATSADSITADNAVLAREAEGVSAVCVARAGGDVVPTAADSMATRRSSRDTVSGVAASRPSAGQPLTTKRP